MIVRMVNVVFSLYFFAVAVIQYNDPDPWLWMPAYLVAFVLGVGLPGRPRWAGFARLYGGAVLLWAVGIWLTASDWQVSLHSESYREAMGLLLVGAWAFWAARYVPRPELGV